MVYYCYGCVFADSAIVSTSYDNILLTMLIAEIWKYSNFTVNRKRLGALIQSQKT